MERASTRSITRDFVGTPQASASFFYDMGDFQVITRDDSTEEDSEDPNHSALKSPFLNIGNS